MNTVYIGLGSNLGNREKNIEQALDLLNDHPDIDVIKTSSLHETMAVAAYQQPNFLNGAAVIYTFLTPLELLDITEDIEKKLGRQSKGLGDPRIIDIDILFYNDDIVSTDRLNIPHSLAHERLFVLTPLNEVAPEYIHPIMNISISELKDQLHGY